jgi:hypothetical protein
LPLVLKGGAPALVYKKGVPLEYSANCSVVTLMGASWQYSWSPLPQNCPGVENVPMISVPGEISTTLGGNSQWIMGFNEPDEGWQPASMTPAQGAFWWRLIEQKYPNKKLLSPGTGSEDYTHWLRDFRQAYIDQYHVAPRMDGLAAHCLKWWASQSINDCVTKYISWTVEWGASEVWVSEFAFANLDISSPPCPVGWPPVSDQLAAAEERTFLDWMTTQPTVTRYAWFTARIPPGEQIPRCFHTPLVDYNTGQPTIFGTTYITYH